MTWRARSRGAGLDAGLVVLAVLDAASVLGSEQHHRSVGAALAAASVAVFLARRIAPVLVSLSAFALVGAGFALSPTTTFVQFVGMIGLFGLAGASGSGRRLVPVAGAGLVLIAFATLGLESGGGWPDLALSAFICEGALVLGALVARRGHRIERLAAEMSLSDEREALRTRAALADERARIARELHDVVSHGLSVVVVQTQAARHALDDTAGVDPDVARHLTAVESTARDALAEMRRMLGLLQLDDLAGDGAPEPPSQGLDDLPALVDRARRAGLAVSADVAPVHRPLGTGRELAIYRIVQESLTNAVKHAPGADAGVAVRVAGAAVEVEVVSGPGRVPARAESAGGGHGLIGMRERVLAYGGRLDAGPTQEGGFRVHAVLPLDGSLVGADPGGRT